MDKGVIRVADHQGTYVIQMQGDIRLTLSLSFDDSIERMLADSELNSVIFDLSSVQAIDSTTLGLMAKIAIRSASMVSSRPMVISNNAGITRLLESMGFADIFEIVSTANLHGEHLEELLENDAASKEDLTRQKVIEAHKLLVSLNSKNKNDFKELLESLESS